MNRSTYYFEMASSSTTTHLPLLPSARRNKLQIRRAAASTKDHNSLLLDPTNQQKNGENDDPKRLQLTTTTTTTTSNASQSNNLNKESPSYSSSQYLKGDNVPLSISSPTHPFIATFPLPTSINHYDNESKEKEEFADVQEKVPDDVRLLPPSKNDENKDGGDDDIMRLRNLKHEQLQTFSFIPPLSASTTSNSVTHFIHTTVKYLNNLSIEVDDKLTKFEDTIESLEIKLSLIENKLDSTRRVEKDNIIQEK